jgi:hypothetical protein
MNDVTTLARRLTVDDIVDLRAYERRRPEVLRRMLALKRRRRIAVGPLVTLTFENRETMRFQVQEMARAEKMTTDAQIRDELDIYNPLIPGYGELSATLFIELTSRAELEEWLPKLVGIERAVEVRIGEGVAVDVVRAEPEAAHAQQLTRDDVTASVHYIRFRLTDDQLERFSRGPVVVAVDLPAYQEEVALSVESRAELRGDLQSRLEREDRID